MNKGRMVKCFFNKSRKKKLCEVCSDRFICLTNITNEDWLAYVETIPSCILRVPNTEEGRAFWGQFKKYLNKERYRAQRYGRAKNRKEKGGNQCHTPIGNCDYFGVYLRDSELAQRQKAKEYEDNKV